MSAARIGIDVGAARVGVAVTDPGGVVVLPLTTLARDAENDTDISQVAELVAEREAAAVVVGLPLNLDGSDSASTQAARQWATRLSQLIGATPVHLVDERLTTVSAYRDLRDGGKNARQARAFIDQQSAALILQVALDTERATGRPAGVRVGGRKPRTSKQSRHSRPRDDVAEG